MTFSTKCLVSGVAGFIGSQLAEKLLSLGYEVIGIDCFTDYYPRSAKQRNMANFIEHPKFTFMDLDLVSSGLGDLVRNVSYIFHEAAQPGVRVSWGTNFELYLRNNVLATQRLLEAVKGVPIEKFVMASSSSVYGDSDGSPIAESAQARPISPYGATKLAAENLCQLYYRNYGVPVVCLRYFTVYGPRQRPDMAFYRFIKEISLGEPVTVYGDGRQSRDFTYVSDAVNATIRAAESEVKGEAFNVGSGSSFSLNYALATISKILGKGAKVKREPPIPGELAHACANVSKIKSMLGYQHTMDLRSGLAAQAKWQFSLREQ